MAHTHKRIPEVARRDVTFHAYPNHITAIYHLGPNQTIGVRFESPEEMMHFVVSLMEKAALTWPDHPIIKEYLSS